MHVHRLRIWVYDATQGRRNTAAIYTGIASNGGAAAFLVLYALADGSTQWSDRFQLFVWEGALATGTVTLGLIAFGIKLTKPS